MLPGSVQISVPGGTWAPAVTTQIIYSTQDNIPRNRQTHPNRDNTSAPPQEALNCAAWHEDFERETPKGEVTRLVSALGCAGNRPRPPMLKDLP